MVKRKYPRIEVSQRTYDLLILESVFVHRPIREIIDELVESHMTKKTILVLDQRTALTGPIITKPVKLEKAEVTEYKPPLPPRVKKLGSDLEAQTKVKDLYNKGIPVAEIARQIGIAPSTIRSWIAKQIVSGKMVRIK